jgi:cobaltochelatase CobS
MPLRQSKDLIAIPLNTLPGLESLPAEAIVNGFAKAGPNVPPRDPDFLFDVDMVRPIIGWLSYSRPDGLMIFGDTGCGKSSHFHQFHAYTNRPMLTQPCHQQLEYMDLLGTKELIDGETITVDGPLLTAARLGAPLLLEEFDRLSPATSVALNAVLDGYPIVNTLNGGEVIVPASGFGVAMTANTNGSGDTTGDYPTANVQDRTVLERAWVFRAKYPTEDVELQALRRKVPSAVPEEFLRQSIRFANDVRQLYGKTTGNLSSHARPDMAAVMEMTVSRRALIRLWNVTMMYPAMDSAFLYALEISLTNRCLSESCAKALLELAKAHFQDGLGLSVPAVA